MKAIQKSMDLGRIYLERWTSSHIPDIRGTCRKRERQLSEGDEQKQGSSRANKNSSLV